MFAAALLSPFVTAAYARPVSGETSEGMSFLSWIVLGLISGYIGSMLSNRRGEGIVLDILLGVAGAFTGGFLFRLFGASGVTGLNIYSVIVSVIGAVVLLSIYHLFRRRRAF